ncbi:zinc finger CCCH domain-containing protein 14-like [Saccostrea echinata]|uniref:zinc finger CCCH domain-containing protein 14-like n=1 Tax=Saccostrea echinata TaxID=191078 RepID=UPI002A816276|nr:zinc finger CCCH domain-containing protein 14-like [Saccostrea echinata]
MDHGKDISHKIRSAIKAKLIELNAYVDDELPDYIMVMIANKKTEKQMNSDLNLFLSHNTEKFTSWLHILLKKLQSLGTDQQKSKELEKAETKDNDHQKEIYVDKKEKQGKRQLSTEKKEKTKEKIKDSREKTKEVKSVTKEGKKSKAGPEVDPEIEDLLTNKEEDEFAAEFKEEPSVTKGKTKPADKNASSQDNKQKVSQVSSQSKAKSAVKPVSVHSRLGLPISPDKERRTSSRDSPPGRTVQRPSSSKRTVTPPRRRQPTSVVASVKRKFELEEEEEYDPYNPAVGSVASVVQVSSRPRKSSVPITKQANKSLILKATAEAEKSVSKAMNAVLKEEKLYSAKEDARTRLKKPVTVTLHGRSGSSGVESRKSATAEKATRGLVSNSKKTELMKNMKYTIENKPKSQKVQEVAHVIPVVDSRYIEIQDRTEDGDSVHSSSNTSQQLPVGSDDDQSLSPDVDPDVQQLLQQESERDLPSQGSTDLGLEEASPEELEEADIDEDDDVTQRAMLLKQQSLLKNRKRTLAQTKTEKPTAFVSPVDTRFIVTLDGVNPDRFEAEKEGGGGDMEISSEISKKTIVHSAPEVKPITFSLKDTDDEEEEEVLPSKAAKLSEKCRFWPACVNGNACLYHHPTMPCKMFPQCKFGDKCLYIHPNCKFDAQCTRKDCPFTHASKRNTSTTVIQKIVQVPVPMAASYGSSFNKAPTPNTPITCRFFPNCSNVQCTFYHPKPCRFGIKCMNKPTCTFYHPSVPSKSQLTWTSTSKRSSIHISQRQFDAGAAESLPVSLG